MRRITAIATARSRAIPMGTWKIIVAHQLGCPCPARTNIPEWARRALSFWMIRDSSAGVIKESPLEPDHETHSLMDLDCGTGALRPSTVLGSRSHAAAAQSQGLDNCRRRPEQYFRDHTNDGWDSVARRPEWTDPIRWHGLRSLRGARRPAVRIKQH